MTEIEYRRNRAATNVARLQAPDVSPAEESELLRQLSRDARWLRVPVTSLFQAVPTPLEGRTATSITCCGRTFHSQAAYKGHLNSRFHREEKGGRK